MSNTPLPKFVRTCQIVGPNGILPLSRATWYRYVKDGKAPKGNRAGRIRYWKLDDVLAFATQTEAN